MEYPTLTHCFLEAVDRYACPRAQMYKRGDHWETVSAREMLRQIASLSCALGRRGIRKGDRVGLFSPNRPEWHVADLAILGLGAVSVPVYFNESPDRLVYILNHSGARLVVTAGAEQARRLLGCRERLGGIKQIIVAGADNELDGDVLRYETEIASGADAEIAAYRDRAAENKPDQLATIIYTSGTTGEPKGVMLTHANISSNVIDGASTVDYGPGDLALSFLPLAHVYERLIAYSYLFRGVPIAYVERIDQLAAALLEVRPTVAAAVPRVFEKIYANLMEKGHSVTGWRRNLFDWSMRVAHQSIPWRAYAKEAPLRLKAEWSVADKLVFAKIRAGLGGRIRAFSSGGAPLSRDLAEFLWAVGVPIYQGYGLTEASPVVSTNEPGRNKVGSVGRPIRNVEVRIANDGEILVRGPCVMRGYYQKPAETRETISDDGWLKTGDVGYLDQEGYLYVTDRKKDLLKTAAGKFVAPQPIENVLKTSPFILNAAVLGDRRKFVVALIVPNFANVEARAREQGLHFSSRAELRVHPWVQELVEGEIQRLTSHLAQYETIKRFALLEEDFTFDNGGLTYTMKLKRRVVEERYAEIVERLYDGVAESQPNIAPVIRP